MLLYSCQENWGGVSINERVKAVRNALNLMQKDFGQKLTLAQTYLSQIEKGNRDVTKKIQKLICLTFNVSEEWLQTGTGEMFIESDSTIVFQLSSEYGLDAFEKAMINGFLKMKSEQRAMLKEWVKSAMYEVFDNEQAYKEFREEYDKGRALPFAARGVIRPALLKLRNALTARFPPPKTKTECKTKPFLTRRQWPFCLNKAYLHFPSIPAPSRLKMDG